MFTNSGYGATGGAKRRYQAVDLESQVEGASPHRLVAILFDELLKAIDIMLAAQRSGNRIKLIEKQGRARSILLALETSLDFKAGGELALNLYRVYRECRRLIHEGGRGDAPAQIETARGYLGEIAGAWEQIG